MTPMQQLTKMPVRYAGSIEYHWPAHALLLNALVGRTIGIEFNGAISCVACQRSIRKTYNQGYCYPCMMKLAACDYCIVAPERCHFTQGTCRQPDWGLRHCMQSHLVYLANTSTLKVGVTRVVNVPMRWIDQGASQAIGLYLTTSRYAAGIIESALKDRMADKTNWRKMLQGPADPLDLDQERARVLNEFDPATLGLSPRCYRAVTEPAIALDYPVMRYPERIQSYKVTGATAIGGELIGIKGQYLLLDGGVLNLRKYSGYHARLVVD